VGGHEAGGVLQVLHADGHAGERPDVLAPGQPLVDRRRLGQCRLAVDRHERPQLGVVPFDAVEGGRHDLPGGDLTAAHLVGELDDGGVAKVHERDVTDPIPG
jgi:hypothetical protein